MKMKKILSIVTILGFVSLYGCAGMNGKSAGEEQKSTVPGAPTALKLMVVPNGLKLSWNLSPKTRVS
jgi:hypothetical protein